MITKKSAYWLTGIVFLTVFVYFSSVNNEFTHWDDDRQVTENSDIKELTKDNLKIIFSSFYLGMYQPLSSLTYAVEYHFFRLNPVVYHITNLLLHLLNVFLVFVFLQILFRRVYLSIIVASFFAVHPLQVEAVAWISARSTLLFSFFYLGSLIFYLKHIREKKAIFYIASLILFVFSLFSKVMAISLPFILVSIDFLEGRKISRKLVLSKIPFFALSLIFGIIVIISREEAGHIHNLSSYSFFDRMFIIPYQISLYIYKAFVPIDLSIFYQNPAKIDGMLPLIYYFSMVPIVILGFILFKKRKLLTKEILWGLIFFIVTISPVLKVITYGNQLIAERYMYLAIVGISVVAFFFVDVLLFKKKIPKTLLVAILSIYLLFIAIGTFNRLKVWKSDLTLFTDFVRKSPEAKLGWYGLGVAHNGLEEYKEAIEYFDKAIDIDAKYLDSYYYRGLAHFHLLDYNNAIRDFNKCIGLTTDPIHHASVYSYLGVLFSKIFNFSRALEYLDLSIKMDPNESNTYYNLGHLYFTQGNYKKAHALFDTSLELNPDNSLASDAMKKLMSFENDPASASKFYMNSGIELAKMENYRPAIHFLSIAILKDSTNILALQNRALVYYTYQEIELAKKDIIAIMDQGGKVDPNILEALNIHQ